jgi:hypothetical protein
VVRVGCRRAERLGLGTVWVKSGRVSRVLDWLKELEVWVAW